MTRINIIPPRDLTDQHLIAEIREINMVYPALKRSLKGGHDVQNIPPTFTLNKGHVKFFYDKGKYLCNRWHLLKKEATERGFTIKTTFKGDWKEKYPHLWNDWKPTQQDFNVIIPRILLRIGERPNWYRYKGEILEGEFMEDYVFMLKDYVEIEKENTKEWLHYF